MTETIKKTMKKSTHRVALSDISQYLTEQNVRIIDEYGDGWVVTPARMYNKHTRKLNAELGVNKVNYYGNTNGSRSGFSNEA